MRAITEASTGVETARLDRASTRPPPMVEQADRSAARSPWTHVAYTAGGSQNP